MLDVSYTNIWLTASAAKALFILVKFFAQKHFPETDVVRSIHFYTQA